MRYRRFGSSDLVVSEVGFGTWTLVTDWWGRTDHPHAMITAALDAGINFIDTAPVYGTDGAGESDPRAVPHGARRHRHHDEVRLRHQGRAQVPRPVGTPDRLAARVDPPAVRRLAAPARHRPHRPLPAAQPAHRADPRRRPVGGAARPEARRARCASSASRSAPRSAGSRRATARSTTARSCRCRPCSTRSSRSRAARSRSGRACSTARSSLISRVPHASDSLSGKADARHGVRPKGDHRVAPQPRQHARQLREGRGALVPLGAETGRTIGQAAIAGDPREPRVHVRAADGALGRRRAGVRGRVRPAAHRRRARRRSTRSGRATSTTSTATSCR